MMIRWNPIIYLGFFFSPFAAMGQTNDSVIVKALKDPKADAHGAKADVFIQDKKIMAVPGPELKKKKKCKRNPTK